MIGGPSELRSAFAAMAKAETQAVVVQAFFDPQRTNIIELAAKHRLAYVEAAGGLVSMAANLPELYERSALYVDKILKGTKPADLPVEQPTKFQVAINMKTATRSRAIARCRRPGSASRASLQPADVTCAAAQAPPAPRIVRRQQYFPPHVSSLARVPWP